MTTDSLIKEIGYTEDWRVTLARLAKYLKPKQIIEMGAEWGYSTKMILDQMPEDCMFYSVDIQPNWGECGDDPRLVKIARNDTDMTIWSEHDVDLKKTDLWEIDSDHSYKHISKQWELYSPYFKKGCVIMIDDLDTSYIGVTQFWNELPKEIDKKQIGRFGIIVW